LAVPAGRRFVLIWTRRQTYVSCKFVHRFCKRPNVTLPFVETWEVGD
jgi:hypothetical protein